MRIQKWIGAWHAPLFAIADDVVILVAVPLFAQQLVERSVDGSRLRPIAAVSDTTGFVDDEGWVRQLPVLAMDAPAQIVDQDGHVHTVVFRQDVSGADLLPQILVSPDAFSRM